MGKVEFNVGPNAVIRLGEDLYKNIYGVLIEYITNSYDADATVVNINVNSSEITITDNGIGMSYDTLKNDYMDVGRNRRKNKSGKTTLGRLVTGRKGFGKLACFGLFKEFKIETVQDGLKSILKINTGYNQDGDFFYDAFIDDEAVPTKENNGTKVFLIDNNQSIPEDKNLASSIAKRLNIMYGKKEDEDKFVIELGNYTIDKVFRDNEVIKEGGNKLDYRIPEDIDKFLTNTEDIEYIKNNKIHGIIIAREKTVNIKENKGIVLFARGKLCQEATYLNINPSNSYGYAYLYGELHVDFIDDEKQDNIGTDRTALKSTETTEQLFKIINKILKSYANLYDKDEKEKKETAIDKYKNSEDFKDIKNTIDSISNDEIKKELLSLLDIKINNSIKDSTVDSSKIKNFKWIAQAITPTYILKSEQIFKNDAKDNISTSYDTLLDTICKKYNYNGKDGDVAFNEIYGENNTKYAKLSQLANSQNPDTQKNIKTSIRELGKSIAAMRNATVHTTDRKCYNETISKENSKRFLVLVDLFLEMDKLFYTN
ncbi:ATP-binding protein [Aliarcobacter butzleri]|uniref:ATP-binding protein n=1 Tax=Aliarcobacter butzleri TaxID=28197 RepID=UPI00317CDA75